MSIIKIMVEVSVDDKTPLIAEIGLDTTELGISPIPDAIEAALELAGGQLADDWKDFEAAGYDADKAFAV